MNPPCPTCARPMSRQEASRNVFACAPCRELIQFFDVGVKEDHTRRFGAGVILEAQQIGA